MSAFEITAARPWPLIHPPSPWTTADLARRLGVRDTAVRDWRQGLSRPSPDHLEALLSACWPATTTAQRSVVFLAYGYVPPGLQLLARSHPDILTAAMETMEASRSRAGSVPSLVGGVAIMRLAQSIHEPRGIDVLELLQKAEEADR